MQNKPKFTKCPNEPKSFETKNYEPRTMNYEVGKTKPNKAKLVRRRRIVSYAKLKGYETNLDFWLNNPKAKLVLSLSNGTNPIFFVPLCLLWLNTAPVKTMSKQW